MTEQSDDITLREAQALVDRWITTVGVRYFSPLTNMAILAEETGEVARIMARTYGEQSFKPGESPDLANELADLLWVTMAIANQTGVDLTDALARNIQKKNTRDCSRHRDNPKLK
jgi:NTP pyrophosphatase (non-canonical NTP hydrolase)